MWHLSTFLLNLENGVHFKLANLKKKKKKQEQNCKYEESIFIPSCSSALVL